MQFATMNIKMERPEPHNQRPKAKSTKRVNFEPKVHIRKSLHLNNFTDEEFAATWYTSQEFLEIKLECQQTLQMINAGVLKEDNEFFCLRGLEVKSRAAYNERLQMRNACRSAVFQVQDMVKRGKCGEKLISKIYKHQAKDCKDEAYALGIQDQEAAHSTYQRLSVARYKSKSRPRKSQSIKYRPSPRLVMAQ